MGAVVPAPIPCLPKSAIEQMLDRYGVDIQSRPTLPSARQAFKRLNTRPCNTSSMCGSIVPMKDLYIRSLVTAGIGHAGPAFAEEPARMAREPSD